MSKTYDINDEEADAIARGPEAHRLFHLKYADKTETEENIFSEVKESSPKNFLEIKESSKEENLSTCITKTSEGIMIDSLSDLNLSIITSNVWVENFLKKQSTNQLNNLLKVYKNNKYLSKYTNPSISKQEKKNFKNLIFGEKVRRIAIGRNKIITQPTTNKIDTILSPSDYKYNLTFGSYIKAKPGIPSNLHGMLLKIFEAKRIQQICLSYEDPNYGIPEDDFDIHDSFCIEEIDRLIFSPQELERLKEYNNSRDRLVKHTSEEIYKNKLNLPCKASQQTRYELPHRNSMYDPIKPTNTIEKFYFNQFESFLNEDESHLIDILQKPSDLYEGIDSFSHLKSEADMNNEKKIYLFKFLRSKNYPESKVQAIFKQMFGKFKTYDVYDDVFFTSLKSEDELKWEKEIYLYKYLRSTKEYTDIQIEDIFRSMYNFENLPTNVKHPKFAHKRDDNIQKFLNSEFDNYLSKEYKKYDELVDAKIREHVNFMKAQVAYAISKLEYLNIDCRVCGKTHFAYSSCKMDKVQRYQTCKFCKKTDIKSMQSHSLHCKKFLAQKLEKLPNSCKNCPPCDRQNNIIEGKYKFCIPCNKRKKKTLILLPQFMQCFCGHVILKSDFKFHLLKCPKKTIELIKESTCGVCKKPMLTHGENHIIIYDFVNKNITSEPQKISEPLKGKRPKKNTVFYRHICLSAKATAKIDIAEIDDEKEASFLKMWDYDTQIPMTFSFHKDNDITSSLTVRVTPTQTINSVLSEIIEMVNKTPNYENRFRDPSIYFVKTLSNFYLNKDASFSEYPSYTNFIITTVFDENTGYLTRTVPKKRNRRFPTQCGCGKKYGYESSLKYHQKRCMSVKLISNVKTTDRFMVKKVQKNVHLGLKRLPPKSEIPIHDLTLAKYFDSPHITSTNPLQSITMNNDLVPLLHRVQPELFLENQVEFSKRFIELLKDDQDPFTQKKPLFFLENQTKFIKCSSCHLFVSEYTTHSC